MDYAEGKIDPKDMTDRVLAYQERWGFAEMPGIVLRDGVRDEEILAAIDDAFRSKASAIIRGRQNARDGSSQRGAGRTDR